MLHNDRAKKVKASFVQRGIHARRLSSKGVPGNLGNKYYSGRQIENHWLTSATEFCEVLESQPSLLEPP
jgi:hypothetical protein